MSFVTRMVIVLCGMCFVILLKRGSTMLRYASIFGQDTSVGRTWKASTLPEVDVGVNKAAYVDNWPVIKAKPVAIAERITVPVTAMVTTRPHRKKELMFADAGSCPVAARRHIAYVKVQKTASTTVRVIFQMFALKNNLQICMDSIDFFHMGWPSPFVNELVLKPHGKLCDLIAEEMVYSRKELERVMHKDTIYLASVADPIKHFMSMFNFNLLTTIISNALGRTLTSHQAVRIFLKDPELIRSLFNSLNATEKSTGHQLVLQMRNLQLHDLGVPRSEDLEVAELQEKVDQIISEFHFIILASHFDESMVLLKNVLCWSLDDLMYVRLNAAQSSKQRKQAIPQDIAASISKYHAADLIMYAAVNKTFWKMAKNQPNFQSDLKLYKEKLARHSKLCNEAPSDKRPKECFPLSIETFWEKLQIRLKKEFNDQLLPTTTAPHTVKATAKATIRITVKATPAKPIAKVTAAKVQVKKTA